MILARRGFLIGLGSALAAPAIVRISSIMPVKAIEIDAPYGRSPLLEVFEMIRNSDNQMLANSIDWDALVGGMIPADRAYWQKSLLSTGT